MKRIIGVVFFVFTVSLFSCQNEKVEIAQEDISLEKSAAIAVTEANLEALTTAADYEIEFYANAEKMLTRWWRIGKKWNWSDKTNYQLRQCPNVEITEGENDGYPKLITLNYGDATELKNGKVLSGIIIIEISAPKASGNFTRTVTYQDFGVDGVKIVGTSLIEVDKENSLFRSMQSDLVISIDESTVIERSSTKTWTWIEGMETTDDQTDDVFYINGMVSASNSDGDTYEKKIMEDNPLVKMRDCRFIVSGLVEIKLNNELVSTMNYGDGDCDSIAILTKADGEEVEIDLSDFKGKENQRQNQNRKQKGNQSQNQSSNQNSNQNGKNKG